MDFNHQYSWVKDFGLSAVITTVVTALVNAITTARKRHSKASLLEFLAQPAATEAFASDEPALNALRELRRSLVFERAFGLRMASGLRDQLLQFANERKEFHDLQKVVPAGRIISRILSRSYSTAVFERSMKMLARAHWILRLLGYFYIFVGYALFFGGRLAGR